MRSALLAAGLGLSIATNAHMFLSSPAPIEGSAPKSPLDASGSNFPCHGVTLPTSGGEQMAAGSSQLLAWDLGGGANTAVHGGGSCQISITYETDADKVKDPKNWYVIYSIEGGCPSNTVGNLEVAKDCSAGGTNGVDCVNSFNFTVPNVKSGHAIMAWTWFNTVGNREMYMNCVNAQFSGGDGSDMSELPNMFVGNLASIDTCPTTESVNLAFPNPGKYLTTKMPAASTAHKYPFAKPSGAGCAGDGGSASGGSGSGSGSSVAASSSAAAPASSIYGSASAAQSAAVSQATEAAAGGNAAVTITTMATVTGAASTAAASSYAAPSSAAAMAPSSGPSNGTGSGSSFGSSGSSSSSNSTSGSCANGAVSCSTPGSVVCIGSSQFGLCDTNSCAVPQALAAGTQCSGGTISKRSSRHARKHIAGRLSF